MASRRLPPGSISHQRQLLEDSWGDDCDIDPLILRARLLHQQGRRHLAAALEQEVMPLF